MSLISCGLMSLFWMVALHTHVLGYESIPPPPPPTYLIPYCLHYIYSPNISPNIFLQAIKYTTFFKCKQTSHHSISPTRLGFYFLYELATYTSPYILCSRCCGTTKVVLCQVTPKYCSKCTSCFSLLCTSFVLILL